MPIMIKKKILALFVSFCFSAFAEAGFSFGANSILSCNLGTTCEDPEVKSAVSKVEDFGWNSKDYPVFGLGANVFFRYNIPKLSFLGIQADASYISQNGFITSIDTGIYKIRYKYSYKSFELTPLVTCDVNFGKVYCTFVAGPNFSIPFGDVSYSYKMYEEENKDLKLESGFMSGLTAGGSAGTFIQNVEIFFTTRYTFDFKPVEYSIAGEKYELLTRRCLISGIGARYVPGRKK